MRKNWSNVDVDLDQLVSTIQKFFGDRGFLTTVDGSFSCGFVIRAEASDVYDVDGGVAVSVNRGSGGLTISFDFDKREDGVAFRPLTMSFFGGGIFFVRHLKSNECRIRLEKEFWKFIDNFLPSVSESY